MSSLLINWRHARAWQVTTLTGLGDNSQVDGSVATTTFRELGGITATSNGMRILVSDRWSIRQILPLGDGVSFPPLSPPLPAPPPPPPWANTFIPSHSRDHVLGSKGGNIPTAESFPSLCFIKPGGYVTRVGFDNGLDKAGWAGPTDGGYTAIYTNRIAWTAVKDNGEIFCWGGGGKRRSWIVPHGGVPLSELCERRSCRILPKANQIHLLRILQLVCPVRRHDRVLLGRHVFISAWRRLADCKHWPVASPSSIWMAASGAALE